MIKNYILRIFILPIYLIFGLAVWLRNKLFDFQILKSYTTKKFSISVGNLAVGGTGKTPMIEYLVHLFKVQAKTAILSRGYGRKTKGFLKASIDSDATIIGDEPYQYFLKYGNKIDIYVGEKRVEAYKEIVEKKPETNLILLDDAFQHRYIKPSLNIVLTDYNDLIVNDLLIPFGRLREPISGLKRADIVIVSKCKPEIALKEAIIISGKMLPFCKQEIQFFFTKISYHNPVQFNGEVSNIGSKVIIVSALANPSTFDQYCTQNLNVIKKITFADHHDYSNSDLKNIESNLDENTALLTTEKDYGKLIGRLSPSTRAYYLPIKTSFLFEEENRFNDLMLASYHKFYQNN